MLNFDKYFKDVLNEALSKTFKNCKTSEQHLITEVYALSSISANGWQLK